MPKIKKFKQAGQRFRVNSRLPVAVKTAIPVIQ
jgi:hypothetical protein